MDFADKYTEQMKQACEAWRKRYFPEDVMSEFERTAQADIAGSKNVCTLHGTPTMERLYPQSIWLCAKCAQYLFEKNKLHGIVFDMTP